MYQASLSPVSCAHGTAPSPLQQGSDDCLAALVHKPTAGRLHARHITA